MGKRIEELLRYMYGEEQGAETASELTNLLEEERRMLRPPRERGSGTLPLDQKDAFVISYGDHLRRGEEKPLSVLAEFAEEKLSEAVSGIHVLPFFPYSSDDGFSIIDYYRVDPALGDWDDVERLGRHFKLMSDLVLGHCSVQNEWFRKFLAGDPEYRNFFIALDPETDLSEIVRPRTHPLLTPFESSRGTLHVWTTFSADQVDLNYAEPRVLLEMLRVLLFHVRKGVQVIRLDAVAYLWKEVGHPSIHHPKTHAMVKLFRAVVEEVAPWVVILTETNVPHEENIAYFGNLEDEAHMVYQFSLPPLVLDAFLREDTSRLAEWAASLPDTRGKATFFNFLASHDGIGLLPAHGILSKEELQGLVEATRKRGGYINYKTAPGGEIPYEMNITYLDAVAEKELEVSVRARKFLASQAIMLMLQGVPGIYLHSLLGSGNYTQGVERSGENRRINREKLDYPAVKGELEDPASLRGRIFGGFIRMLRARRRSKAFDPAGSMKVLDLGAKLIGLLRTSPDGKERVLCLVNVTPELVWGDIPALTLGTGLHRSFTDLIQEKQVEWSAVGEQIVRVQLSAFGIYFLRI